MASNGRFPRSPTYYAGFFGKSCDLERFREANVFTNDLAHSAAAGSAVKVTLTRRQAPRILRLMGAGGAPNVTVGGPGGTSLTAASAGVHQAPGIIVVQSQKIGETLVALDSAVPGTYTVTTISGPAITDSAQADELPEASIHGHVSGTGTHLLLRYVVKRRPGQRVRFYEVSHGIPREIGSVAGGCGKLRFTSSPGRDRRTIIASVSVAGVPSPGAQRIAVAHFRAPRFVHPGRPGRLRVGWSRSALTVSWARASAATHYAVTVHERRGSLTRIVSIKTKLRLPALHLTLAGTVSVVAESADGTRVQATIRTYRAKLKPVNRFLTFASLRHKTRR